MDASQPVRIEKLAGRVTCGPYAAGSKSQRIAHFLETDDGKNRYVLRRKNGPVFGDMEVARLMDKEIECAGFLLGTTFLADHIQAKGFPRPGK